MINTKTIQYPYEKSDLKMRTEYSGGDLLYVGYAAPGTATSATAWQICKLTYDAAGNVTQRDFASGANDFAYAWDNRAAYSYS